MSGAEATGGLDRLPWLGDEGLRAQQRGGRQARLVAVLIAASVLVIALTILKPRLPEPQLRTSMTVRLPAPKMPPGAYSQPVVANPVRIPTASAVPSAKAAPLPRPRQVAPTEAAPAQTKPLQRRSPLSNGRLIQVGAFGSTAQAERGWESTVRANDALAQLAGRAVEARNSKGRSFYRYQLATTSQAHSEVLCQRLRKKGLSCVVMGLASKANVRP